MTDAENMKHIRVSRIYVIPAVAAAVVVGVAISQMTSPPAGSTAAAGSTSSAKIVSTRAYEHLEDVMTVRRSLLDTPGGTWDGCGDGAAACGETDGWTNKGSVDMPAQPIGWQILSRHTNSGSRFGQILSFFQKNADGQWVRVMESLNPVDNIEVLVADLNADSSPEFIVRYTSGGSVADGSQTSLPNIFDPSTTVEVIGKDHRGDLAVITSLQLHDAYGVTIAHDIDSASVRIDPLSSFRPSWSISAPFQGRDDWSKWAVTRFDQ